MMATGPTGVLLAAATWLDLLVYGTCLAGILLVAAAVIELVRRWLRRGERPLTPGDQLAHYRSLYKRGEISQEEFDNLRAVLGGEVARAAKPPTPPTPTPPPAPPTDGATPE